MFLRFSRTLIHRGFHLASILAQFVWILTYLSQTLFFAYICFHTFAEPSIFENHLSLQTMISANESNQVAKDRCMLPVLFLHYLRTPSASKFHWTSAWSFRCLFGLWFPALDTKSIQNWFPKDSISGSQVASERLGGASSTLYRFSIDFGISWSI